LPGAGRKGNAITFDAAADLLGEMCGASLEERVTGLASDPLTRARPSPRTSTPIGDGAELDGLAAAAEGLFVRG
jgi:hypothetical protein